MSDLKAILRETPANRNSWNAVTAILDHCGVAWEVVRDPGELEGAVGRARRRATRPLVFQSFTTPHLGLVRAELQASGEGPGRVTWVAGGAHPTADPEGALALGFQHVFVGGAEHTLPAFLAAGGTGPSILREPAQGPADLDAFVPWGKGRRGPVELTRGCPWRCGFCGVGGRRVRHRGPHSVFQAVEALRASGMKRVFFLTPNALRYGRGLGDLRELLAGVRARGLAPVLGTFPSEARPESVTPESLALLREFCDNRTLVIGAQSGSDAVLERLARGHRVEDARRAARLARENGFLPHVDLIFGLPEETPEEQRATLELGRSLRRDADARVHAHFFHPLPGTPLWGCEPTPLLPDVRTGLIEMRAGGAETGKWLEHEVWVREVREWVQRGWIRV